MSVDMFRAHLPSHLGRTERLGDAAVTLPGSGLILGSGQSGGALVVRMFRREPVRACVVSVGQLVQLIAYRAIAIGAHVTVVTDNVPLWSRLVQAVPRGPNWLSVLPSGNRVTSTGSATRPSLVVDSTADHQALPSWEQGPWQTFVSVQTTVSADDEQRLRSYDLLITQQLAPDAAEVARRSFALAPDRAGWLTQMPPGVVAVAAAGQLAFGQLTASAMEQRIFGGS